MGPWIFGSKPDHALAELSVVLITAVAGWSAFFNPNDDQGLGVVLLSGFAASLLLPLVALARWLRVRSAQRM